MTTNQTLYNTMTERTLYDELAIKVVLTPAGDVIMTRTDRYMRNPTGKVPAFVHQKTTLLNIYEDI